MKKPYQMIKFIALLKTQLIILSSFTGEGLGFEWIVLWLWCSWDTAKDSKNLLGCCLLKTKLGVGLGDETRGYTMAAAMLHCES